MAGSKRPYAVYRVIKYGDGLGNERTERTFVGRTYAVSAAKARVNVEYRERGKALYGRYAEEDLGGDAWISIEYEAEEI